MKKISISILAFSGIVFLSSCSSKNTAQSTTAPETQTTPATAKEEGLNLSYMDTSVRPQDDFFNYVNGNWVKTAVIPSDKGSWGSFNELREKTDENSLAILKNILTEKYAKGSEGQKIQDLYATYIDWNKRNAEGIEPIKADLAKIDAIQNLSDFYSK